MLVGYVSDERYLALADVLFEFTSERGVVSARSPAPAVRSMPILKLAPIR